MLASEKPLTQETVGTPATHDPAGALAAAAYREVKAAILTCYLRPGSLVFATDLAKRFEMSPTPVHEALKALCREGLLSVRPRRGYVVTEISERDIEENFELRLLLEVHGAGLAAERSTSAEIASLRSQYEAARADWRRAQERFEAGFRDDLLGVLESGSSGNTKFHVAIAAMSGNQRLEQIVAGLLEANQRAFFLHGRSPKAPPASDYHGQILAALTARDPDAARTAMAAHLRDAQERIVYGATRGIAVPRATA